MLNNWGGLLSGEVKLNELVNSDNDSDSYMYAHSQPSVSSFDDAASKMGDGIHVVRGERFECTTQLETWRTLAHKLRGRAVLVTNEEFE